MSNDRNDVKTARVDELTRVFSGFLNVDKAVVTYVRYDGTPTTVTRLSLERGDSVAVLAVDWRRNIVWLTEQFRYPTLAKGPGWLLELPAGAIDPGETPEQAARRETLEEIGIAPGPLELVSTFYLSPGGSSERIHLFYADVSGQSPDEDAAKRLRDRDEDIRLVSYNLDDFCDISRFDLHLDAKTIAGALWLYRKRM